MNRKYIGYPGFASLISSDNDYFVFRRFDRLHCRVLLKLQDQLTCLEERLDNLDIAWAHAPHADGGERDNSTLRQDDEERKTLLEEIQQKLQEYGETKSFKNSRGPSFHA